MGLTNWPSCSCFNGAHWNDNFCKFLPFSQLELAIFNIDEHRRVSFFFFIFLNIIDVVLVRWLFGLIPTIQGVK